MKKSIYSLVLFDEVVEAVDRLAYQRNTNRSQLINDILAEKVGLLTPEQKIKKIINRIIDNVTDMQNMQVKSKTEFGSIQFGTYLKYKYKPTIRYSYEFYTSNNPKYAVLKVSSRTKSEELNKHLSNFFNLLIYIDKRRFNEIHAREVITNRSDISNNKFSREFLSGISLENIGEEYIAEYLSNYLIMLDQSLKYYFTHLDNIEEVAYKIDSIYCKYLRNLQLFRND